LLYCIRKMHRHFGLRIYIQTSLASKTVCTGTKRIYACGRPWDTHGKSAECGDGRILIIGRECRGGCVRSTIYAVRIVDPDGWSIENLHGAGCVVDAFNDTRTRFEKVARDVNQSSGRYPVDHISSDLILVISPEPLIRYMLRLLTETSLPMKPLSSRQGLNAAGKRTKRFCGTVIVNPLTEAVPPELYEESVMVTLECISPRMGHRISDSHCS
jgi:hypothetical protein